MKSLIPTLAVTFVLWAICHARASSFESGNLVQTSSFHPATYDLSEDQETGPSIGAALERHPLLRLNGEALSMRDGWRARVPYFADMTEKRFRPSGFMGSRGKRLLPGLEPLLLARYYQGKYADKWKRQPHQGFHGSRG